MVLSETPSLIGKVAMALGEAPGDLCIRIIDDIDDILAEVHMEKEPERYEYYASIVTGLVIVDQPDSGNQEELEGITEPTKASNSDLMCHLSHELGHED